MLLLLLTGLNPPDCGWGALNPLPWFLLPPANGAGAATAALPPPKDCCLPPDEAVMAGDVGMPYRVDGWILCWPLLELANRRLETKKQI